MSTPVTDSYAPFGTLMLGAPARLDPSPAQLQAAREADRMSLDDLMAMYGWFDEDFDRAKGFGLPQPTGIRVERSGRRVPFYSRSAITSWAADVSRFAAGLTRRR